MSRIAFETVLHNMGVPPPYPSATLKKGVRQHQLEEMELAAFNTLADTYYQLLCIVALADKDTKLQKLEDLVSDLLGKMTILDEARVEFNGAQP